ncbi:glycosyltransferase [Spongisporangium articulatum]|uniref:Glycosyltransferase n=1 Tax=Spongisporangium articulatum TaxID=3362603 RepID=A0ABW8AKW5_9ACTN
MSTDRSGLFRVFQIPGDHPYLRPLVPTPELSSTSTSTEVFTPEWVQEHADSLDVVHLHFGFDRVPALQLAEWVSELQRHDLPLVFTVHDLTPFDGLGAVPDLDHQRKLDMLVADAAAVLALTDADAETVHSRWGRSAEVAPYPLGEEQATQMRCVHARLYAQLARARRGTAA